MINLLPPELKDQYIYGRRNTVLRRWALAMGFGIAGVAVVTFTGLFFMEKSIVTYRGQVNATSQHLADENLEKTREHSKQVSADIKLATDVLSKEILFSKLLTQIAKVIPPRTSLTDLNISSDQTGLEIKALAADYLSAAQLQVNLQDPANPIFAKADIQTITCGGQSADPKYQCTVTIKALFKQNNQFLYLNKDSKAQ
jgi:Tfp pilus assembly protein PilN